MQERTLRHKRHWLGSVGGATLSPTSCLIFSFSSVFEISIMDSQSSSVTKLVEGTTGVTGGELNPRGPSKVPKGETIPG